MEKIDTLIQKILQNRVLSHVLYWTASVLLWAIVGTFGNPEKLEPLVNKLCYLPGQLFATYSFIYYLLPKFAYKKKYLSFGIFFILSAYVSTVLARFFKIYVYESVLGRGQDKDSIIDILTNIPALLGQYILWVYFFTFFTVLVKLIKDHFEQKKKEESLKKDKATAELGFLKAQLHPHFLFNTLNNLYTLTLYKSDEAPDIVLKLAQILDYTLHQDKNEGIAIQNAFKHGASGDHGRPKIHIDLRVKNDQLQFEVFNSKPKVAQKDKTNFKKGIGMNNVKRQLVLLYANQHQFNIQETIDSYRVVLEINLAPKGIAIA